MSFTAVVKNELCSEMPKKPCCRRSLLLGLLFVRGRAERERVELPLFEECVLQTAERLIQEQCGRESRRVRLPNAPGIFLSFSSSAMARFLHDRGTVPPDHLPDDHACPACQGAFLRGLFLSCGSVSDPRKASRLEFSCGEWQAILGAFLASLGFSPRTAHRRKEQLLYFRDSTSIEDMLTYLGAKQANFTFIDGEIERNIRNEANRQANCDASNINKSIAASAAQVEIIRRLIEKNKLSFLPPELEETARERLAHTDLSIGQLAAIMRPPLTKSGLNHRLTKIQQMGRQLLSDEDAKE